MESETIGKYKNCTKIAIGGMGAVYLATHPELKRKVVIKKLILKSGGAAIRERFKREARILSELSSPYVVRMFDYFTEGRANYIVLEFVDGMSLDKLIEKQVSLPPELALLIFLDACLGLKNAHSKDIVHRDIKPGNILISKRAEVKLADFGIASDEKDEFEEPKKTVDSDKTVVSTKNSSITQAGSTLGTPAYMSPEQLMDSSSVDVRADIYSMGVMLYEMVTGSKPYAGDMSPETIAKIKKGKYIPPQKIVKNLPPVVKTLIRKMMKPEPEKRYKSLEPVIAKVRRYLKNYDTHAIRVSLAQSIISTKTIKFPLYIPKNYKAKRIALGACAVCAVALLFCEAWNSGMIHRTVLRNWFTPVSLSMLMPSTASVNADLPARAFFFVNDNDGIPEVPNTRRVFSVAKNSSKGKNLEYITKDVFLRPGEYRIKIAEGPYVWWKSISVGKEKVIMNLDFLKNASRNITVHFSAMDCETGKDLTQSSLFRIQVGSKWVDASKVDFSKLKTGNVYKFLMIHEGYYDEYFSLLIDWYQDELFITGNMRKK
ncbi:MAG: serine/threonine protein kinase [Treponema succinifaciens]|uniref:serine/threonine-protein kinase n=2 Tax=Treponema succinifaciens TaxID=167 RepID=UPI00235422E4|nr:serine/threonine-protein kinase [Treponema succinifaciens]MCI6911796.1 serine/threonine protein kinase [Treponema succinifaciens]